MFLLIVVLNGMLWNHKQFKCIVKLKHELVFTFLILLIDLHFSSDYGNFECTLLNQLKHTDIMYFQMIVLLKCLPTST